MSLPISDIVAALNGLPPEALWLAMLVLCFAATVAAARWFGAAGLTAYVVVAVLGANLQVLKPVQFSVFADPVALGTVLFASTYLATDMLAELYGRDAARRAVAIGFAAMVLWTLMLIVTLGFAPLTADQAGEGLAWALPVQGAMETLFTPVPALLIAGLTAYLISQYHDVWLYGLIHRLTGGRHLWLRNTGSTAVSALIDTVVFSLLAWVVLAPEPLGWRPLVFTYILGTWALRLVVAALDTPFIYLARWALARRAPAYA
ncbi:MAG: queuosine precursor transporter [Rhodospirillaceae bacterium]|nr:queuosine precursor transporter [Rhodospirillaceae bacterium]